MYGDNELFSRHDASNRKTIGLVIAKLKIRETISIFYWETYFDSGPSGYWTEIKDYHRISLILVISYQLRGALAPSSVNRFECPDMFLIRTSRDLCV